MKRIAAFLDCTPAELYAVVSDNPLLQRLREEKAHEGVIPRTHGTPSRQSAFCLIAPGQYAAVSPAPGFAEGRSSCTIM